MKSLSKISVYKYAVFSHTPTFGWYVSLLSIFLTRERRLYNESINKNLFCFSYSKREGGITDSGMLWKGKVIRLELFFVKIFSLKITDSLEVLTAEDFE